MSVPVGLLDAGNAAVFAATAAVIISVLQWTFTSPWWNDPIGRTVIFKDFCLMVLLVPASLLLVWPDLISPFGEAILVLCSTAGIALVLSWRCVVWYRIKRPWPLPPRQSGADKTL